MVGERRKVTSEEFEAALADPKNAVTISKAARTYRSSFHPDDLEQCCKTGLWRCLQYHRDGMGMKFETNLFKHVKWELDREARRQKSRTRVGGASVVPLADSHASVLLDRSRSQSDANEVAEHVRSCVDALPEKWQRTLIRHHYLEERGLDEMAYMYGTSRDTVRKYLKRALLVLKDEMSLRDGDFVGSKREKGDS